jgi:hypothetical protein
MSSWGKKTGCHACQHMKRQGIAYHVHECILGLLCAIFFIMMMIEPWLVLLRYHLPRYFQEVLPRPHLTLKIQVLTFLSIIICFKCCSRVRPEVFRLDENGNPLIPLPSGSRTTHHCMAQYTCISMTCSIFKSAGRPREDVVFL